jgi:hypothetical protein
MKNLFVIAFLAGGACGPTMVTASQEKLKAQANTELACAGAEPKVVYYGIRSAQNTGETACFGPTADKLAVVECGQQRRAYWGFGDRWEARPETVTAVEADHVEISMGQPGGAVEAVARCGH